MMTITTFTKVEFDIEHEAKSCLEDIINNVKTVIEDWGGQEYSKEDLIKVVRAILAETSHLAQNEDFFDEN